MSEQPENIEVQKDAPDQDAKNVREGVSEIAQSEAVKIEDNSNDYLKAALESNESEAGASPDLGIDAAL